MACAQGVAYAYEALGAAPWRDSCPRLCANIFSRRATLSRKYAPPYSLTAAYNRRGGGRFDVGVALPGNGKTPPNVVMVLMKATHLSPKKGSLPIESRRVMKGFIGPC